jgi:Tol biopolymer transport system component
MIVGAAGGEPTPLTTLDRERHTTHRWPRVLPDGRRYLFFASHRDPTRRDEEGMYVGDLDGGEPRLLARCRASAELVDGWLLFVRDGVLLASRVDLDGASLTGDARVVARDIAVDQSTWHGQFSASASGTLVFNRRPSRPGDSGQTGAAVWYESDMITVFDGTGRAAQHFADGLPIGDMALSPDGYSLILSVQSRDGTSDLWVHPTSHSPDPTDPREKERIAAAVLTPNPRRLTFLEGTESRAVWSPASDEIVFARHDGPEGTGGIYRMPIEGGAERLLLTDPDATIYPEDWTSDGAYIIYKRGVWQSGDEDDLWALPVNGGEPFPLVQTPASDAMARVSPDGRWLAFASRQEGRREIYVVPFPPAWPESARSRRWQISLDGGHEPRWDHDGSALFYISGTAMLMRVPVTAAEQTFEYGRPEPQFQTPYDTARQYDLLPPSDVRGARLVFMDSRQPPDTPITVILNWQRLLASGGSG